MKKLLFLLLITIFLFSFSENATIAVSQSPITKNTKKNIPRQQNTFLPPFSVKQGRIIDAKGKTVQIRGVNWFGFQGESHIVNGLWKQNYQTIINQISNLGFNAVRLPICSSVLRGTKVSSVDDYINPDLKWLDSLTALDKVLKAMADKKLFILIDFHDSICATETETPEAPGYTLQNWKQDLEFIATRYKKNPYIIGIDLKNEPHGKTRWGNGDLKTDWRMQVEMAGNAVLRKNPNLLIFIEGIVSNSGDCEDPNILHDFWGRNLEPINCYPINPKKIPANKLVLSPHIYGPWVSGEEFFNTKDFPNDLAKRYEKDLAQFTGKYAIVIGEFGGDYEGNEKDQIWQDYFIEYLKKHRVTNFFYWSWNPNSTNTKGIVQDDWSTVNEKKYQSIKKLFQ